MSNLQHFIHEMNEYYFTQSEEKPNSESLIEEVPLTEEKEEVEEEEICKKPQD